MSIKLSSHGLTANGTTPVQHLLVFIDSVLRGVGQVMLQNNSYAGLLFLIGIFWNSALFGVAVLVGTSVSTATAMLLAAKPSLVREGHFGFNGALVAIAIMYFLQPEALTWAYVIFAAACTTIVSAAMRRAMDTWNVPPLTAPFVLTTLCFVLACARFGRLHSTHILPTAVLTAIALGSVLFVLEKTAAACALLGTIAAAVVFAAISAALEPLGMPALTLPFVLVVWFFALASPLFPKLRAPPSVDPSNA
jgi:urea transporter